MLSNDNFDLLVVIIEIKEVRCAYTNALRYATSAIFLVTAQSLPNIYVQVLSEMNTQLQKMKFAHF